MFCKAKSAKKKKLFFARLFYTTSKQKCSNVRPILSITFPQGFRISKNIGHLTLGSGGKKTVKWYLKSEQTNTLTNRRTNRRTFWLIESIGPEGRCFENGSRKLTVFFLSSTLRSWLHKISTRIKFCPLDWRTTRHWNVVLAIFQHNHICQVCWKNTRSTFECMVILQSRGQGSDSCWKYRTDLSRSSPSFWTLSPWFENNHTFKCWSGIFATILTIMIMLENCQNNISVYGCSPIQGTKCYSCGNLMKPGSQSGT